MGTGAWNAWFLRLINNEQLPNDEKLRLLLVNAVNHEGLGREDET
jgi:hypothetical protein